MPIVLTTNEVVLNPDHAWDDVEGVQYHYPNQYKNKIKLGEEFVYYRGVHRRSGRRGEAEYFGKGRIGAIRIDPATAGSSRPSWFCRIEEYQPFNPPVPAKPNGVFFEEIPKNMWRNGVRSLAPEVYSAILRAAGAAAPRTRAENTVPSSLETNSLIIPRSKAVGAGSGGGTWRKSKQAKEIGDWAEALAVRFIAEELKGRSIVHRAAQRETPGWDVEYQDAQGELQRVEVKGTVGAAFTSIDLTAGELKAAQAHGEGYWLFLVAGCLGERPRVQRIRNPAARISSGGWTATPSLYSVRLG